MENQTEGSGQGPFESCQLKIDKIFFDDLRRNDFVFFQNDIWRCQSLNLRLFQNLDTKEQKKIPVNDDEVSSFPFSRIEKLELVPKEWKHQEKTAGNSETGEAKITLKGQELGLGPMHEVEVVGMRRFEELEVVRSEKLKGRDLAFKVLLCKTRKQNCYLMGGIDFLN